MTAFTAEDWIVTNLFVESQTAVRWSGLFRRDERSEDRRNKPLHEVNAVIPGERSESGT